MHLSDLYDADQRKRDPDVSSLASKWRIPHQLSSTKYADGTTSRTAGREVRTSLIDQTLEQGAQPWTST